MFHLAAYTGSIGTTVDTDIAALTDDILVIQNNHFVLGQPMRLLAAAAMSATILRAKLVSATLRQIASPWIRPIIGAAIPGNNPNVMLLDDNPPTIKPFEELQILGTSGVAMTEQFTALLWLADSILPKPQSNIYPLRFTSTTAAVANKWTTAALTFADTIPSGVYAAVYSECQSTNAQAHRWIFSNQVYRPGFLSHSALTNRTPYSQQRGTFGTLGVFRSNDLPRLQVLVNGTDASHEGYLWVERVGDLAA
jgi:hypothetical protein